MTETKQDVKLSVRNLCFSYGNITAINNVNLDFLTNNISAIIGPSGCGKSTLLRCLNRVFMLYPNHNMSGEILLDNVNILNEDLNELRRKIGMVFQRPTPFPMSIFDNVAFGVRLHESLKTHELAERVEWALKEAGLWDEVKDKLKKKRFRSIRWTATKIMYRSCRRD